MYKIPGKYGRAIIAGILGVLIIGALVAIDVNEGRKLYPETSVPSFLPPPPTPIPEGQEFGLFLLLILGTIFIIGLTGLVSVLVQRASEGSFKDAILVSGLAGSIPCLAIFIVTVAGAVYELLFLDQAYSVLFIVAAIFEAIATFIVLDLVSIIFGIFAWGIRKVV
jgi:hypothetical protein